LWHFLGTGLPLVYTLNLIKLIRMTTLRTSSLGLFLILEVACSSSGAIPAANTVNADSLSSQHVLAAPQSQARAVATPPQSDTDIVATAPALSSIGARDIGAASAQTPLSLALTLQYRNQQQLDRLVLEQATHGSAQYHHWLTNAQFVARFAPSQADYTKVVASLRAAGFHIDTTYENRTVVDATAPVETIDRYFRTSIHRVSYARGSAYANVENAYAPKALAGLVLNVDGLNTLQIVHADYATVPRGAVRRVSPAAKTQPQLFGPISAVTGSQGYSPLAFWAAYDLPIEHTSGAKRYDGSGRASGIVIDADFAESDLRTYLSYFNIQRTGPATKRVLLHGGPKPGDGAPDSVEATLDAEALVGDAPGTALYVYEIPSFTSALITDAYNTAASDNQVDGVNSSFGGCEQDIGAKTVKAWKAIAEQAAAKGMTFHASSGDAGGSLCAIAPASVPYVVAVGGTSLTVGLDGAWAGETAWSGSSGGISDVFARPSWQAKVAGTVNRGRNAPDLAFDANPETGFAFFYTATWNTNYNPLGGTSLSSPIFGAAVAQIDQVTNARMGAGGPAIYGVFSANGYGTTSTPYFHDIVQGSNGPYDATTGYDLVTGIGSVDVWNTAQKL
jgi:subtilase family serine protease